MFSALRILRISQPDASELGSTNEHKFAVGKGGFRIEASRNIWDGSGLHIDSANTDVAWCQGSECALPQVRPRVGAQAHLGQVYSNKILTSARNGELIMWDMNKTGPSKCGKSPSTPSSQLMPIRRQNGGYATILGPSMHWHIPLC